jgi:hypothetical protein
VDLRETLRRGITFVGMTRRHLAELRTEGDLGGVIQPLVAKEDDLPFVQRRTNRPDLRVC